MTTSSISAAMPTIVKAVQYLYKYLVVPFALLNLFYLLLRTRQLYLGYGQGKRFRGVQTTDSFTLAVLGYAIHFCIGKIVATFISSFEDFEHPIYCTTYAKISAVSFAEAQTFLYLVFLYQCDAVLLPGNPMPRWYDQLKQKFKKGLLSFTILALMSVFMIDGKIFETDSGFKFCAVTASPVLNVLYALNQSIITFGFLVLFLYPFKAVINMGVKNGSTSQNEAAKRLKHIAKRKLKLSLLTIGSTAISQLSMMLSSIYASTPELNGWNFVSASLVGFDFVFNFCLLLQLSKSWKLNLYPDTHPFIVSLDKIILTLVCNPRRKQTGKIIPQTVSTMSTFDSSTGIFSVTK